MDRNAPVVAVADAVDAARAAAVAAAEARCAVMPPTRLNLPSKL
jgi:hypothetical protein